MNSQIKNAVLSKLNNEIDGVLHSISDYINESSDSVESVAEMIACSLSELAQLDSRKTVLEKYFSE